MTTTSVRPIITTDVPELAFAHDIPLVASLRGGHVETLLRGTLAVSRPNASIVLEGGEGSQRTYLRSSAKPFQAMALILTGAASKFSLSTRDLAIAASSHSGEPEHIEAVVSLEQRAGVKPDELLCGVHAPLDAATADAMAARGESPTTLHNNCSGKHSGMLAACKAMGWPADTYLEPAHPLQRLNRETMSAFSGIPVDEIDLGVDGCGVPAFYLSISSIATAFARFATGEGVSADLAAAAQIVRDAMTAHPFLVAGTSRFDTCLMRAAHGKIVCKGGAQGFQGIGLPESGLGIGIKMTSGSGAPVGIVATHLLKELDIIDPAAHQELRPFTDAVIRNHAATVVGATRPMFSVTGMSR